MAAVEIMEDLFFIERGYLNANQFVYCSENPVLIDTGYLTSFEETAGLITGLGVSISDVRLIINTHCHSDHIGGNKIIQDQSGCDIALHKFGKYFIDTKDDWATWWRYFSQDASFFRCTKALEDGDIISIGPHQFEVIHTPGHSSDGIVLYNRDQKLLFSSDTLWEQDVATIAVRVEGTTAVHSLEKSLEKLARLDVDMVYPGHGRPFNDFNDALKRGQEKIKDYLSNRKGVGNDLLKKITIYTLLAKRSVPKESFFQMLMGANWFRETVDLYFDGNCEGKYDEIISDFLNRGLIVERNGGLCTTVKP
jgi:hydroxyacylglutathione hydrolase